jgi:hypothetical protein
MLCVSTALAAVPVSSIDETPSVAHGQLIAVGGGPGGVGAACFSCHGLQGQGDAGGAFQRLAGLDAHFHYVLIGGMVFPIFAALYYWTPVVSGRLMSERLGRWAFALIFVGFNAAFLPMHLACAACRGGSTPMTARSG